MAYSKTAVVSGAAKGVGRAVARLLADKGYNLVLTYRTSDVAAAALAAELCRKTRVELRKLDVRDSIAVDGLFAEVSKIFPTIDLLVNNAGIAQQKLFTDLTDEDWRDMIDTDLSGAFYMTRAAVKRMLSGEGGSVINVSSVWGVVGGSTEVHYSAAKAGLIGMTLALASELELSGVKVNAVALGAVDTDMIPVEQKPLVAKEFNGILSPEQAAEAIVELAESQTSGQVLKLYDRTVFG